MNDCCGRELKVKVSHKVEIRQKVKYDSGNVLKRKDYLGKISFSIIGLNAVGFFFFLDILEKTHGKQKKSL